jgi:hypothetical protein
MASRSKPEAAPAAVQQPEQPQELLSIDTLREKHKVTRPIFAGVCAANDWKPGRAMTEEAFLQAVADFTGAPMGAPQGKRG